MLHDRGAVFLDHFARHDADGAGIGERVDEARPRSLQLELHRVAIERLQAFDRGVVFELAGLERTLVQFIEADDAFLHHAGELLALGRRVEEALVCVDHVMRRQLALLAPERCVVGKVDAPPHLHGIGTVVGRDLRHSFGQRGHDFDRARQVVVAVQRLEDVGGDDARIQVRQLRRVEPRFCNRKSVAEHLFWWLGWALRARGVGSGTQCQAQADGPCPVSDVHGWKHLYGIASPQA